MCDESSINQHTKESNRCFPTHAPQENSHPPARSPLAGVQGLWGLHGGLRRGQGWARVATPLPAVWSLPPHSRRLQTRHEVRTGSSQLGGRAHLSAPMNANRQFPPTRMCHTYMHPCTPSEQSHPCFLSVVLLAVNGRGTPPQRRAGAGALRCRPQTGAGGPPRAPHGGRGWAQDTARRGRGGEQLQGTPHHTAGEASPWQCHWGWADILVKARDSGAAWGDRDGGIRSGGGGRCHWGGRPGSLSPSRGFHFL